LPWAFCPSYLHDRQVSDSMPETALGCGDGAA
jgi:hypothetical protein